MLQATESLIPIILLVCLGSVLARYDFINVEVRSGLERFTYWIALPSLFIHSLAGTDFNELAAGNLVLVLTLATVAMSLIGMLLAWFMKLPKEYSGVFVQAGFRGNLAFVGLPLIIFALNGADITHELVSEALLALAALIPLYNLISIFILITAKHKISVDILPRMLFQMVKNPLIISAVVGGLLGWVSWDLPVILGRPLELLGQTALALALVTLGVALVQLEIRGNINISLIAGLLKVAGVPVITYGLSIALNLSDDQTFVAMIFAACPTAAASYILATQLGGDDGLAATSVVISTLLSMGALTVVLMLF